MNDADKITNIVSAELGATGLIVRGGFYPKPSDAVPGLPEGKTAATVLLIGNAGPDMWPAFRAGSTFADGAPDPLNRWSRTHVEAVAKELGGHAVYPFEGPPYHPFQRWAARAEPVFPSPTGPLIHPVHGLWHAYRAALLFSGVLPLPARSPALPEAESPCLSCADRPCLATCPVGAFTPGGYDVAACVNHVSSAAGADCLGQGCRARRACPVGQDSIYQPEQAEFHMTAFVRGNI